MNDKKALARVLAETEATIASWHVVSINIKY
jgi:hypothetical protein